MADGTITFSTALDNGQLEKDLKQAERDVDRLKEKVEKSESSRNAIEAEMERAEAAIHETEAAIDGLKEKLAEVPGTATSRTEYEAQRAEVERIGDELSSQQAKLEEQVAEIDKLNAKWQKADGTVREATAELDRAKRKQAEIGEEYARTYSKASASTSAALASAEARFDKFGKRVNTMMRKVFVFSVILAGLRALKGYIAGAMAENERFSASFSNLKAVLAGFGQTLLSAVLPAVTAVVNMLAAMLTTLARLIDSVFKTDIAGAIARARQAAQATEDQAAATKKLAKATKEASKQLMAFDEVNAMSDDSSSDAGVPGDAAGTAPAAPNWDALDAGKIDEKLAEIMLILGAALLAVGAILAFSGINIPLGLTLMAIGALMVYTAYQEQWGKLPQEVRDAITAALVITGLVLLVLGAVLAFSGANIPLGIGMMLAGAALLATAAALNWDGMPEEVKSVITAVMTVLGGALLVLGAVLALTGANVPLGVGLIAAGAISLATAAAINWGSMPEDVKGVVVALLGIVGAALLAIGGALAFSGASIPLGLGLIAAGALSLASAAALAWNELPDGIRGTVSTILGIVGGALIVIGIILCVTGVGIPLGIGCILAGAGSLAAAAAINWDFLKDKVAEIWRGIVNFWNQNIAPIFTTEWWANLFKSIANGLISILNGALSAVGGFFSMLSGGISSFLGAFGVNFSFSVPQVQIPYLAAGAVIPPNREFMAVLGDQKRGTNLETPEGLMRQIVREESAPGMNRDAMQQAVAAALMQVLPMLLQQDGGGAPLVLQVDSEVLAKAVNKGNASLARRGLIDPVLAL